MKKVYSFTRSKLIIMITLSLIFLLLTGTILQSHAEAKEITISYYASQSGTQCRFPGYNGWTYYKYIKWINKKGKTKQRYAYCIQPNLQSQNVGWKKRKATQLSGKNDISHVMYFTIGAPGEDDLRDYLKDKGWNNLQSSTSRFYAFCHMLLGYAYNSESCFNGYGSCTAAAKKKIRTTYKWIMDQTIISDPDFTVHVKSGTAKKVVAKWNGQKYTTKTTPYVLDGKGNQFFYLDVPSGYTLFRTHTNKKNVTESFTYKAGRKDVPIRNHDTFYFEINKGTMEKTKTTGKVFDVDGEQTAIDTYVIKTSGYQDAGFFYGTNSADAKFTVAYQKPGTFSFTKNKDSFLNGNETEKNAEFQVYRTSYSSYVKAQKSDLAESCKMATNSKGIAKSDNLVAGKYKVVQTAGNDWYNLSSAFTVTVGANSDTSLNPVKNPQKSFKLKIIKRNKRTGKPVAIKGAHFKLKDSKGNYITDPKTNNIAEWITDDTGAANLDIQLNQGEYTIEEIKSPDGYQLAKKPVKIHIYEGSTDVTLEPKTNTVFTYFDDLPFITLSTTAKSSDTNSHQGIIGKESKIIDTVHIENLIPGNKYKLKGQAVDSKTGTAYSIKSDEGSKTFTATDYDMNVDMNYTIDSSELYGKSVVIFEQLYNENDEQLAKHEDLNDKGQTIYFPEMNTKALVNGSQLVPQSADKSKITLIDTISYKNLIAGKYKAKGTLIDKTKGEPVKNSNKDVEATAEFTVDEGGKGYAEVKFEFDASELLGHEIVAYETIFKDDVEIANHKDINDEGQTIYFPEEHTTATDTETNSHMGHISDKALIKDVIEYKGLKPNKEYTQTATLMDKETGKPLLDTEGKNITKSIKFTPKVPSGQLEIEFEIDSSLLQGKTIVAFEKTFDEKREVAFHENLDDENQSIHFPDVKTTATINGLHVALNSKNTKEIDAVKISNVIKGKKFKLKAKLMYTDGSPVQIDGKDVTAETEVFDAPDESFTKDVEFNYDASMLEGKSVVAYEYLYNDKDKLLASHEDKNDFDQTVQFTKIKTTATDTSTETHLGGYDKKTIIVDEVPYENFVPGIKYRGEGTLVYKDTGMPVIQNGKKVTNSVEFTPQEANGSFKIEFSVDATLLKGKTTVAFEHVYVDKVEVAAHVDLNAEEQSVHFPDFHTLATANGEHTVFAEGNKTLTDKITYTNLYSANSTKKLTAKLTWMDKKTGNPVKISGKELTGEVSFTPKKLNGTITVKSENVDLTNLKGKDLVAFEKIYYGDTLIGSHEDLNDKGQTIHFKEKATPPTKSTTPPVVKTGDMFPLIAMVLIIIIATATFVIYRMKKKGVKEEK